MLTCEQVKPSGERLTFPDLLTNFEKLTTIQKAELFEAGIAETSGDDLDKVLWLKSPSSEVTLPTASTLHQRSNKCMYARMSGRYGWTDAPTTRVRWQ